MILEIYELLIPFVIWFRSDVRYYQIDNSIATRKQKTGNRKNAPHNVNYSRSFS
jgi:hypothetical protein